jgi:hypothetical protein
MELENFADILLKESLHRSLQNNLNQAEAGYNAKWFRRGGIFAMKWILKRTYSEKDMIEAFYSGNANHLKIINEEPYQNAYEWLEEFKNR